MTDGLAYVVMKKFTEYCSGSSAKDPGTKDMASCARKGLDAPESAVKSDNTRLSEARFRRSTLFWAMVFWSRQARSNWSL